MSAIRARVMVVDDDPGVLRAASRVLATRHEVFEIARPAEALARLAEIRPDVAVCDIRMPEMDGFELTARLREARPDLDVILMTGSHSEPDANLVRALRQQAYYFIQKPFHRDVLDTLVARCLETRRLRESQSRLLRRMRDELDEARVFQQAMLAPQGAAFGPVRVAARWRACSELGGDFYDYGDLGDGRVAFMVADVRGHGASAALLTAMVKAVFRAGPGEAFDPGGVVRQLATWLEVFGPDRFVTVFCGVLDGARGTLNYVNAGHPPALLCSPGADPVPLASGGPLVSSALAGEGWLSERVPMGGGSDLLIYTDGVFDAPAGGTRFPVAALLTHAASGARGAALLDAILADLDARAGGRPIGDDVTLLCLSHDGA